MYSSAARDGVRSGVRFDDNSSSSSGSPSSVCSQIESSVDRTSTAHHDLARILISTRGYAACGEYFSDSSAHVNGRTPADSHFMNPDSTASAYLLLYSEPEAPHAGLCRRALYGRRSWEHMLTEFGNTMNSQEEQQFLSKMLARRRD